MAKNEDQLFFMVKKKFPPFYLPEKVPLSMFATRSSPKYANAGLTYILLF
jgi:hypothetical protein